MSDPAEPASTAAAAAAAAAPLSLDDEFMRGWSLPVHEDGDKHARGTVLVVGGSPRTAGAVVLSGLAALRIGAGRLQLAVADPAVLAVTVAAPEALVAGLPVHPDGRMRPRKAARAIERLVRHADAVLFGPGLMSDDASARLLAELVPMIGDGCVLVIDAAAAKGITDLASIVAPVSSQLIVTANRDEIGVLAGGAERAVEGAEAVGVVARSLGAVVTSFGTVMAPDGRGWSSTAGTAGLATSGSGDVLSGLVAGAAARCGRPDQAACWGTFAHAEVGARLSRRIAMVGFLAREIADEVPALLHSLER